MHTAIEDIYSKVLLGEGQEWNTKNIEEWWNIANSTIYDRVPWHIHSLPFTSNHFPFCPKLTDLLVP